MTQILSAQQWTRYWSKGTTTTFFGRFNQNYDGEIKEFWQSNFEKLPQDAKIIDFGTGNGALAILAAQYSLDHNKNFSITAIDYAEIDPLKQVINKLPSNLLDSIEFMSGVNMENTGLNGAQYDAVISQFGFEYGNLEKTVNETSRLLKPNKSQLYLVMHYHESAIIQQGKDVLHQIDRCNSSQLHHILLKLLELLEQIKHLKQNPANNNAAEKLRQRANNITEDLHHAIKSYKDPSFINFFLKNSMAVFGTKLAPKDYCKKINFLNLLQEETQFYKQRMIDLISSARNAEDIFNLTQSLVRHRFTVEKAEEFLFEKVIFGYALCAHR